VIRSLAAAGLLATSIAGIGTTQPQLAGEVAAVQARDEADYLPPPALLRAASLGHRAAVADVLWSRVLTQYGLRFEERRPFPDLPRRLDAILALEPDYAPLFRYAASFLVFHYPRATERDAKIARRYLERGLRARPSDPEIWRTYGEFVAGTGRSFLGSESEKLRWHEEGERAIAHANELAARAADPAASLLRSKQP